MAEMPHECSVEVIQATLAVIISDRVHLPQHVGMAANGALAVDHHAAGQNVGAFDRDGHRGTLVAVGDDVLGSDAHGLARMHIHRIDGDETGKIGDMHLGDAGRHRRLFAQVHGQRGDLSYRVAGIGAGTDTGHRLLNTFEFTDRHVELLANPRVGTGGEGSLRRTAGTA